VVNGGAAQDLAFGPDGRLASVGLGILKIRNVENGQDLFKAFGQSGKLAFSPDGKRLATDGDDNELKVWDVKTGKELLVLKGHTGYVTAVAFSPDGRRLASTSEDKTVKVWDAQTVQELLTLEGHGRWASGVAFSPDGHRLAAGAADGTVKVWDATPLPEKP
jgi:WD40 repeat protein